MRYNYHGSLSRVKNATWAVFATVVLVLFLAPFHAHALDYYHLAINHGSHRDSVYNWARNQLGVMGDQIQGHNPNTTFVNTGLSSWRDSGSFFNFIDSHMTQAEQSGQAFYMYMGGHGSTGRIGSGQYGGWGGVPAGRAQTLNYVNQRSQQLGIPAFVYDGSCGSALCVDAGQHYLSNDPNRGLQGVISSGGSRGGHAGVTYIGPSRGPEAALARMWYNFDALDQRHGDKGYLTLGEALPYLRENASGYGPMSGIGAEGMDTPFFGRECLIGPPRDVCIVVAPGWAAKDENNNVVHDSIPDDSSEYGRCIDDDDDEDADCPYRGEKTFTETRAESPNYDLYHGEQEGSSAHRHTTLKRLVDMAKEDYEHLWKQRYGERNWDEVTVTLVVPNKDQAWEYVRSGFERYNVSGVSVKPGHYVVGRGTNIHPDAGQAGGDNWEGVRANVTNGECTFETAEKPPPAPSPDPMGEDPGHGGGGGPGGGTEDALLSMLGDLLGSLLGQDREPEREWPPEQDPDQDLSEVDEMPDYIVGCPEEFDPVCAIDGRTYFNECVAQMEEKPIAHKGFCGSPISTETISEIPPSLMQQILEAVWAFIRGSGVKEEVDVL